MKKQILFFSTLVVLIFTTHHCLAMEKEESLTQFIPLTNGLLTEIEAKIAQTAYVSFFACNRSITSTTTKKDTVINLIRYQRNLDNSKGAGPYELFCPIVIKDSNGFLTDLGQFDPNKHKEAKEAIRQKQAFYYNGNQGAIIYTLTKDFNIDTAYKHLKDWTETLQNQHKSNVIIPTTCRDK